MVRVFTCSFMVTFSFCLMSSSHAASLVDFKRYVDNLETMAENLLNEVNNKDGQNDEDITEVEINEKLVTTTPTSKNSEVFSCGFGTRHCDLNNTRVNATVYGFKAPAVCRDQHSKCGQMNTLGLCYDSYFGYITRKRCKKSCGICTGSFIATPTTGYGDIMIRIRPQDCTQQQIQARTRNRYCLKINYQRTDRDRAPKFDYLSYSNYQTGRRSVLNFSPSSPNVYSYRGTLTHDVSIACTDYYSYIYIYAIKHQKKHRGELRFHNISLNQGAC